MNDQLTDEQVAYWRRVLTGMWGPFASLISREGIQAYRDRMQGIIDELHDGFGGSNESDELDQQLAPPEPLPIVAEVMAALEEQRDAEA